MVQLFLWTAALFAMACMPAVLSLNFLSGLRPTSIPTLKKQILDLSRRVDRGLTETPADREKMADLFQQLERLSSRNATLKVDALSAVWSLEYTTSDSILGRGGVPKVGPILQTIDARRLTAENAEVRQYFGIFKLPVKVTADLTPWTPSKVGVQFKQFSIGPVSFPAPSTFQSWLDVTYVDQDLRLSRGAKGSIFVLSRFAELDL